MPSPYMGSKVTISLCVCTSLVIWRTCLWMFFTIPCHRRSLGVFSDGSLRSSCVVFRSTSVALVLSSCLLVLLTCFVALKHTSPELKIRFLVAETRRCLTSRKFLAHTEFVCSEVQRRSYVAGITPSSAGCTWTSLKVPVSVDGLLAKYLHAWRMHALIIPEGKLAMVSFRWSMAPCSSTSLSLKVFLFQSSK